MKTLSVYLLSFFLSVLSASAADADSFRNPDRSCRPETWFHLIGGNVSKEGMDADLDAIANAGISGIHLFHGRSDYGEWPNVKKQIPCLSKDWDDLIRFVADGCEKRGLIFKMQNCPGWSMSGGPWIAPPYRCGIGDFIVDGKNELRVDVTSTWFNRLAYDAGLPENERKTWTISAPKADASPKPAGLIGPVTLRR